MTRRLEQLLDEIESEFSKWTHNCYQDGFKEGEEYVQSELITGLKELVQWTPWGKRKPEPRFRVSSLSAWTGYAKLKGGMVVPMTVTWAADGEIVKVTLMGVTVVGWEQIAYWTDELQGPKGEV